MTRHKRLRQNVLLLFVNKTDIKYYFFKNSQEKEGTKLTEINNYDINPHLPVKILIHGWMDDKKSYWYQPTVTEYLKQGGVNVITVHWGKHAKCMYWTSVKCARSIGEHVAKFIIGISKKYRISYSKFHLVGHSLGAHISGFAGKTVILETKSKLGRITGLDPAGPSFQKNAPEDRLFSEDATFVDVIHTDSGSLGYEKSLGHIDFYPNAGKSKQNGCATLDIGCSHKRAPLYFCESINSTDFLAWHAPNYTEFDCGRCFDNPKTSMGEHVDRSLTGDFYLHTNKSAPFAQGFNK